VKKVIENESIKRAGDADSDSSSSEEHRSTKKIATRMNEPPSKVTDKVVEQSTKKPGE
jgi:hypothetical protein